MVNKKNPVKQDLNLAQREHRRRNLRGEVATALILILGIALFCKFGVVDPVQNLNRAQSAATQAEQQLAQLRSKTENYEQVLRSYKSHSLSQAAVGGKADAVECLNLIEGNLLRASQVSEFTVADSLISVQLSGVTLQQVSGIYASLMATDLVENVQVYTAATTGDVQDKVSAALTIQLHMADLPEEEAAS